MVNPTPHLVPLLACLVAVAGFTASECREYLTLSIHTSKKSFTLYEPVVVTASVKNPLPYELPSELFLTSWRNPITFAIVLPDGTTPPYHSGHEWDGVTLGFNKHQPGGVKSVDLTLYWNARTGQLAFPSVGEYSIEAHAIATRIPRRTAIVAEPLAIEIVSPTKRDLRAIKYLGSPEGLVELVRDGPTKYCKNSQIGNCYEHLREFFEAHKSSAYSPGICRELSSFVIFGLVDAPPQIETGIELATYCLERWPRHAEAQRTTEVLIQGLIVAGRFDQAQNAITRFERRWADRREIAEKLRKQVAHGRQQAADSKALPPTAN